MKGPLDIISPQAGPQMEFLSTPADVAIYGGSAGGGKTFGVLLEALRHDRNPNFGGLILRRTTVQIRNTGGLWEKSVRIYPLRGARGTEGHLLWRFPSGATMRFNHMENVNDGLIYQGAEIPYIAFDELTQFEEGQFWFMLSRNRSMCGIRPYIRATCNPDPDSFVAKLVAWWIDWTTGLAIPTRSGVVRWFARMPDDSLAWADTRSELVSRYGERCGAKSFTFIRASLADNRKLLAEDPTYEDSLRALPRVERERLLGGNWLVRPTAGTIFKRAWFGIVEAAPAQARRLRAWDLAATEPSTSNPDPDWTVGLKVARDEAGVFYIEDVTRLQVTSGRVRDAVRNLAAQDGYEVEVSIPQDPGQAGKGQAEDYVRDLAGYTVHVAPTSRDKLTRAGPASNQAEHGNIKLVRAPWNDDFLRELDNFCSDAAHDDQVDPLSDAVRILGTPPPGRPSTIRQAMRDGSFRRSERSLWG